MTFAILYTILMIAILTGYGDNGEIETGIMIDVIINILLTYWIIKRLNCYKKIEEHLAKIYQGDNSEKLNPDEFTKEFKKVVDLILSVYKDFGFENYSFRLSLRDKDNKEKYFDDDDMWELAESELRAILQESGLDFYEAKRRSSILWSKTRCTN